MDTLHGTGPGTYSHHLGSVPAQVLIVVELPGDHQAGWSQATAESIVIHCAADVPFTACLFTQEEVQPLAPSSPV